VSYAESVLLPNERVVCSAKVHWIVFMPAAIFFFLLLLGLAAMAGEKDQEVLALFAWPGILCLVWALSVRASTEFVVTSKRVIARFGFVRRDTFELNLGRVESFKVQQGVLGRLLGYGTIRISGTGGAQAPIPRIADPQEFRRQAAIAIDIAQSRGSARAQAA
jgi:uncharacterized membrane protein YdbT with pleckstrin-like domain